VVAAVKTLGMKVVQSSRSFTEEKAAAAGVTYAASPLEVAKQAYALSIHLPLTPNLKHLINKEFLDAMAPGSIVINTSRGGHHDTAAVKEAIKEKGIRFALDVYENEPTKHAGCPFEDTELAEMCAVCCQHTGASTLEAQVHSR
ncbi:hypothetical protein KIPB_014805, partial [Kipferlia bialata]